MFDEKNTKKCVKIKDNNKRKLESSDSGEIEEEVEEIDQNESEQGSEDDSDEESENECINEDDEDEKKNKLSKNDVKKQLEHEKISNLKNTIKEEMSQMTFEEKTKFQNKLGLKK